MSYWRQHFFIALFIGATQDRINEQLLNLNFEPSMTTLYVDKQLEVYDDGKANISRLRTKSGEATDENVIVVAPAQYAKLASENIEQTFGKVLPNDGYMKIPLELTIRAANGKDYVVKVGTQAITPK
jgi:hypothetical protein